MENLRGIKIIQEIPGQKKNSKRVIIFSILVILIIIIMVLSSYSIFEFDDSNHFSEQYIETDLVIGEYSGYTNESETNLTTINIKTLNLTSLSFTFMWKDYSIGPGDIVYGSLDEFSLKIFPPDNNLEPVSNSVVHDEKSRTGVITIIFQLNEIPKKKGSIGSFGTGNWILKIRCLNATGIEHTCDCPSAERIEDPGNAWTLLVEGKFYLKK